MMKVKEIAKKVCDGSNLDIVYAYDYLIVRGGSASGKTGAALEILAECQKIDKYIWFFDLERVVIVKRLEKLGYVPEECMIFNDIRTENGILNTFKTLSNPEIIKPDVVIVDPLNMVDVGEAKDKGIMLRNYMNVIKHIQDLCGNMRFNPFIIVTMQKSRAELK